MRAGVVNSVNSVLVSALFGQSSTGNSPGVGADLLAAHAKAKAGVGIDVNATSADPNAPLAPVWTPGLTPGASVLTGRAFAGKAFFDLGAKLYSDLGAAGDYKRLFALHSGIATLQALAANAQDDKLSKAAKAQTQGAFSRGLAELQAFFAEQQFGDVRLAQGDRVDEAQTTLALASTSEDYLTGIIHKGSLSGKFAGLDENARFDIVATSAAGTERTVAIDLSQMGSIPRSLGNVIGFINNKLSAAGAASRLEVSDQTPKTTILKVGGKTIETRYTGLKQYALKVDVRAGERVAFEPVTATPAFYVVGQVNHGARLIKLEDVGDTAGQPVWLGRPGATADPMGAHVSAGWFGPGAPYGGAPAGAFEQKSVVMESDGANNFEIALAAPGEAVLKINLSEGRVISISTAWQSADREAWRVRAGESDERARLNDLAERLTQLLHEQGLAAGVDVWESGTDAGLSVFTADGVSASSFSISGRAVSLEAIDPPGMVGGLRDGVFARRFEAAGVAGASDLFVGAQSFLISTTSQTSTISVAGGEDGIDAAALIAELNVQLRERGFAAAASFEDVAGALTLRLDGLHDLTAVSATLNELDHDAVLQAPGAWGSGGLPSAASGQPFGDGRRTKALAGSPLQIYSGAVDLQIVVETPTGNKTISVAVSALERAGDPDPAPGEWSTAFRARLDAALNQAGVYVSASGDLASWTTAESSGQRIQSIGINGDAQTLTGGGPAFGVGGAFSAERSFTSAQAASAADQEIAALASDQNVSITFATIWGERTVSATLETGDPRTLESAALRLNEALAAAGYDLGVAATDLSTGGSGLRAISGASHTIRGDIAFILGGEALGVTLDAIDSGSSTDDPIDALGVAARASRGAAVTEAVPSQSTLSAPSAGGSAWFPGRVFDVAIGAGADVATARAVAAGADGSVYVLADLDGDGATLPIKGARDVALIKYDSAGKQVYSRILGAAKSANGYALAVSADGKVAVAGSVEGALSGAGAEKTGTDSFVTLFDAAGAEQWSIRRGASGNDEVRAIAFAPDGGLVIAGKTESALGPSLALGGSDGYVRGFSAAGAELFTRQFGTGRDDAASALLVRSDGAGGMEIFSGGTEDNRGIVRRFTYASGAGFAVGATRDLGFFYKGAINALAADGASLYVGGEVGADRLSFGNSARGAVAGQEGFVARLDAGLVSTTLDRASYIGSAQDDAVRGLAIVGGDVYAAGVGGGVIAGQGAAKASGGFLARLGDDGDIAWTRSFSSAGGVVTPLALAAGASGASALDALGLPRGVVAARDSNALVSRSALRVGDEFSVGAEGRRATTIKITAGDTLSSLAGAINRAIGASGRARIVKDSGAERIEIAAAEGRAVHLDAGRAGRDGLSALGLGPGLIAKNSGARGALKNFGLGLIGADLKLDTKADIAKTKAELSAAISIVRLAYEALLHPNAKEQSAAEKALEARRQNAGPAPEIYNAQLANYKAALARLGG